MSRGAAHLKRVYTQPWTVRYAKINVALWLVGTAVAVVNFGLGMMAPVSLKWLWAVVNLGILTFDLTMLKWAVTGLLWRKGEDARKAQIASDIEAFNAMVMNEYKGL